MHLKQKLKAFWADENGSETVEFVGMILPIILIVFTFISFFRWQAQVQALDYAGGKAARIVAATGEYDPEDAYKLVNELFDGRDATVSCVVYDKDDKEKPISSGKIQLGDRFCLTFRTTFKIMSYMGDREFSAPVVCRVRGMSEIYNKD